MNARTMKAYAAAITLAGVSGAWLGIADQVHSKPAHVHAQVPDPAQTKAVASELAQARADAELARLYLRTAASVRKTTQQRASAQQAASASVSVSAPQAYAQASAPAAAPASAPAAASGGS